METLKKPNVRKMVVGRPLLYDHHPPTPIGISDENQKCRFGEMTNFLQKLISKPQY